MLEVDGDEPIQETQPEEGSPVEIPVPTRAEVFRKLRNAVYQRSPYPSGMGIDESGGDRKRQPDQPGWG